MAKAGKAKAKKNEEGKHAKGSKLIHLRLNSEMCSEIQQACKDFHYQSPADFLRESAREKLRFLERQKALRKISINEEKELGEKQFNEAFEESEKERQKHRLEYFT